MDIFCTYFYTLSSQHLLPQTIKNCNKKPEKSKTGKKRMLERSVTGTVHYFKPLFRANIDFITQFLQQPEFNIFSIPAKHVNTQSVLLLSTK